MGEGRKGVSDVGNDERCEASSINRHSTFSTLTTPTHHAQNHTA